MSGPREAHVTVLWHPCQAHIRPMWPCHMGPTSDLTWVPCETPVTDWSLAGSLKSRTPSTTSAISDLGLWCSQVKCLSLLFYNSYGIFLSFITCKSIIYEIRLQGSSIEICHDSQVQHLVTLVTNMNIYWTGEFFKKAWLGMGVERVGILATRVTRVGVLTRD